MTEEWQNPVTWLWAQLTERLTAEELEDLKADYDWHLGHYGAAVFNAWELPEPLPPRVAEIVASVVGNNAEACTNGYKAGYESGFIEGHVAGQQYGRQESEAPAEDESPPAPLTLSA